MKKKKKAKEEDKSWREKMDTELLKEIADELRINNIIASINNPIIFNNLLVEEQIKMLNIVKEHILNSAEKEKKTHKTR